MAAALPYPAAKQKRGCCFAALQLRVTRWGHGSRFGGWTVERTARLILSSSLNWRSSERHAARRRMISADVLGPCCSSVSVTAFMSVAGCPPLQLAAALVSEGAPRTPPAVRSVLRDVEEAADADRGLPSRIRQWHAHTPNTARGSKKPTTHEWFTPRPAPTSQPARRTCRSQARKPPTSSANWAGG